MKSYRYSQNGEYAYHRHFTDLRGVDFSPSPSISKHHFADIENMWRDPKSEGGAALESYPGFRTFASLPAPIYGIFHHRAGGKSYAVVHAKDKLYRFDVSLRDYPKALATLTPLPLTVAEEKGCAFMQGESLYLLIGGVYYRILPDGSAGVLGDDPCLPYVPLTYFNGEMYEQRNLLTDEVRHVFTADGNYFFEEKNEALLRYDVVSEESKTCAVYALASTECVSITVPDTARIGGEDYKVTTVRANAFSSIPTLMSVNLPDTVTEIGGGAFSGCTSLLAINLPESVRMIGRRAFYGCFGLNEIYLGSKLSYIGEDAFLYCLRLSSVLFGGTSAMYDAIDMQGDATLKTMELTVSYEKTPKLYYPAVLRYPIYEPVVEIKNVTLDDSPIMSDNTPYEGGLLRYRAVTSEDGLISAVELFTSDRRFLYGKELRLHLLASPSRFSAPKGYTAFGTGIPSLSGKDAVSACRAVTEYDGRIFFTGNPALPNTVFHSLPDDTGINNPLYVGNLSYFNDGNGSVPNCALLGTGEMLIVFKKDGEGDGAIYYHTPQGTGIHVVPRVYPTSSGVFGIGALGAAVHFRDDPVFLSGKGLLGIEKQTVNLERSLAVRSFPVDARLCGEVLEDASLAIHEGMLYLLTRGRIYLADSHRFRYRTDGDVGYEWYFLSGVGAYENDTPLYKRSLFAPEDAKLLGYLTSSTEEEAKGTVYSLTLPSGELLYYEKAEDGSKYVVDCDGERTGGVFFPATVLCTVGDVLLFGTENGALGCMNTDKRGKTLYRLHPDGELYAKKNGTYYPLTERSFPPVTEDLLEHLPLYAKIPSGEYIPSGEGKVFIDGGRGALATPLGEAVEPHRIHRYFYSYASHAYTAACTLAPDDGDIPHRAKDSVPLSAAVKVKASPGSAFSVLVRTDRTPWHICESLTAGRADFGDFDFSLLDFYGEDSTTIPLREREKRWCFKQYRFASCAAKQPFGIYALSYSFCHAGHIKTG